MHNVKYTQGTKLRSQISQAEVVATTFNAPAGRAGTPRVGLQYEVGIASDMEGVLTNLLEDSGVCLYIGNFEKENVYFVYTQKIDWTLDLPPRTSPHQSHQFFTSPRVHHLTLWVHSRHVRGKNTATATHDRKHQLSLTTTCQIFRNSSTSSLSLQYTPSKSLTCILR